MLPSLFSVSSSIRRPSFVERDSASLNFSAFMPVALMTLSCCLNISMMSLETAVADISTACPCESSTAAKPIICGIVISACAPTPAIRFAKLARYGAAAVQFCESSLMTEPTDSRAFSVPSLSSSPKMLVSLLKVSVAPSPNSSSATLIWSAARTKPRISSFDCLPSLPASSARMFICSRGVRVSIFINSSFRSSTCSLVIPVNLRTLAISASMSANALTAVLPAITRPVMAAAIPMSVVCHSFILRLKRSQKPSPSMRSALTRTISAFTLLMASHCLFHSAVPRSMPFSWLLSVESVLFSSFGVALSRFFSTFSTPTVALSICAICRFVWRSSFCSRVSFALSPALAASSMAFSRSWDFFFRLSSMS